MPAMDQENDDNYLTLEQALASRRRNPVNISLVKGDTKKKWMLAYNRYGKKESGVKWVRQTSNTNGRGGLPTTFPRDIARKAAKKV